VLANGRHEQSDENWKCPRAVHVLMLVMTWLVLASVACASSPESRLASAPGASTSSPSPPILLVALPAPPLASATDAIVAKPACGEVMMRVPFCDALAEVWRAVKSDGEVRRRLRKGSTDTTAALVGIEMACHAHPTWHEDCAGNPLGQSDVLVDCRVYIGYEYGDREHDMMPYLRGSRGRECSVRLRLSSVANPFRR